GRERRVHRTGAGVRYVVPVFGEHEFVVPWPADKGGGPNIPFKPEFSHLAKSRLRKKIGCELVFVQSDVRTVLSQGSTSPAGTLAFSRQRNCSQPRARTCFLARPPTAFSQRTGAVLAANCVRPPPAAGERQTDRLSDARR